MDYLAALTTTAYFGSTVLQYLLFFGILGLGVLAGKTITYLYEKHLVNRLTASETRLDDVLMHTVGRPLIFLVFVLSMSLGRYVLTPSTTVAAILGTLVEVGVFIALGWLGVRFAGAMINTYLRSYASQSDSRLDDQLIPIIRKIVKVSIVSVTFIVILDSAGYNVTAIVASLGIGGLAVAFAAKETISDMFGGFNILTGRPFVVGDTIEVKGVTGKVEEIGLRFTRIRDFDGRRITMPNSAVASAEIKNVSSEPTRRIDLELGLTYDTTPDKMEEALRVTTETINNIDGVAEDETAVWFWDYGDSALIIRAKYFIADLDNKFDVKSAVNLAIQRAYEEHGFDMAFPTRTVHLAE